MMDGHMMPANDSIAMMMMQMTFYAGVDCTVLINQWKVCFSICVLDLPFQLFITPLFISNSCSTKIKMKNILNIHPETMS